MKAIEWTTAWKAAMDAHFVGEARDANVGELLSVFGSALYQPPEALHSFIRRAWEVYLRVDETDVGRAAVALCYALDEIIKKARAAGRC